MHAPSREPRPRRARSAAACLLALALAASAGLAAAPVALVQDIRPGTTGSADSWPTHLLGLPGQVFLAADDGANGCELWHTNAAATSASMVKNIGDGDGVHCFRRLFRFGDKVIFAGDDGFLGLEPWISDGTAANTVMLADVVVGPTDGFISSAASLPTNSNFVAVGPLGLFSRATDRALWRTDGTPANTAAVPSTTMIPRLAYRNFALGDDGSQLKISDGTQAGTTVVRTFTALKGETLTLYRDRVVFTADDGAGYEPWITDGTPGGTVSLGDLATGVASSNPAQFTVAGGKLYFAASTPTAGRELWVSDGTVGNTQMVVDLNSLVNSSNPFYLVPLGDSVVFSADDGSHGIEPFISNGTPGNATLLRDIVPSTTSSMSATVGYENIWPLSTLALFAASNGGTGGFWKTDGTPEGTLLLQSGYQSPAGSQLAQGGDRVVARVYDTTYGGEPRAISRWDLDGRFCSNPGLWIPDNASGITDTIVLTSTDTILDLDVALTVSHTYTGDLHAYLRHVETGTIVGLVNQTVGCGGNDLDVIFDDEAAAPLATGCTSGDPAYPRRSSWRPISALSSYDGESLAGHWDLVIDDTLANDHGHLDSWCLIPRRALVFANGFENGTNGMWSKALPP